MRGIAIKVTRKTVYDEILDFTAVPAAVLRYPRFKERQMENETANCDTELTEGTIADYLQVSEGARLVRDNIHHLLSRLQFTLDVLSNAEAETGPNLMAPQFPPRFDR